jgi:hypothetical protein
MGEDSPGQAPSSSDRERNAISNRKEGHDHESHKDRPDGEVHTEPANARVDRYPVVSDRGPE